MQLNFELNIQNEDVNVQKKARKVLYQAMQRMKEIAVDKAPVDRGRLKNSIQLIPQFPGQDEYILTDGVEYGEYIEWGTTPHWPPIEPLKGWAKRQLGDESAAYAVQAKIAARGTQEQPFMRPAFDQVRNQIAPQLLKNEFQ